MNYDRERAMREQRATEDMIRMRVFAPRPPVREPANYMVRETPTWAQPAKLPWTLIKHGWSHGTYGNGQPSYYQTEDEARAAGEAWIA